MTQEFSGKDPKSVQQVTSIGAGPIGAGWAAYFLSQGYKVSVYLHEESEEDVLHNFIDSAWNSLEALGLAEGVIPAEFLALLQEKQAAFKKTFEIFSLIH